MAPTEGTDRQRWLLLIHQLPPNPSYLRVKTARRLQRIGAVAIKNTVYVLPGSEQTLEDFQWTVREIRAGGGEVNLFEARVVDGLTDGGIQQLFNASRDSDYDEVAAEARGILEDAPHRPGGGDSVASALARLRKRIAEIRAIDFFSAPGGQLATALVDEIAAQQPGQAAPGPAPEHDYRGRTWVTRAGVHVDRMASAWLIGRFIDPEASFKFVTARDYRPVAGEVRFDMFDAEFTHDGDRCTFEVLLQRMQIDDPALQAIAETVHDIDLKEAKFDRPETTGLAAVIASIAIAHHDDEARIERLSTVLDDLYAYYRKKR